MSLFDSVGKDILPDTLKKVTIPVAAASPIVFVNTNVLVVIPIG